MFIILEESPHLSVFGQLHHYPNGRIRADTNQFDDVGVLKLLHNVRLLQKFVAHMPLTLYLTGLDRNGNNLVVFCTIRSFIDITELSLTDDIV